MTTTTRPTTALITGASRGLGRDLAHALAQSGWQLILTARGADALSAEADALSAHTTVIALPGDIADATHRAALAQAAERLGGLDALVNNAGILGPSPLPALLDFPLDEMAELFAINTTAQLGILQALAPQLKADARVLNLTSDAAVEAYEGWGGYGASKAALEQISAVFAAENPQWRVYAVDPGDMRTQMHQDAFPGEDISDRPLPVESVPGLLVLLAGHLPSGRYQAQSLTAELATEQAS